MTEYYKIIERILDDESAWISRPNKAVTNRIALGCALAVEKMILDLSRERDEAQEIRAHDIARLTTIIAFLRKRRGNLVIERDEARTALATALNEAADEIDCGCPSRDAALAAESKADLWRACHLGTSCNARQAADIRSMKDRTP
jgi:hypothetical protein